MKVIACLIVMLCISSTLAVTWSNCGPGDNSKIISLDIKPADITLGKDLTVAASILLGTGFNTSYDVSVKLTVEKKELGTWIELPCISNFGSCSYSNICEMIHHHGLSECPLDEYGIPCNCPIAANTYTIPPPGATFPLKNPGTDVFNGWYKVKAVASDPNGSEVMCIQVSANVTTA